MNGSSAILGVIVGVLLIGVIFFWANGTFTGTFLGQHGHEDDTVVKGKDPRMKEPWRYPGTWRMTKVEGIVGAIFLVGFVLFLLFARR